MAVAFFLSLTFFFLLFSPTLSYSESSTCSYKQASLAAYTSLNSPELRERYIAYGVYLHHPQINAYIKHQIENIIRTKGCRGLNVAAISFEDVDAYLIAIPGLLKATGQYAHVGLGRQYGRPVIYVDSEIHDDKEVFGILLENEKYKVLQWEKLRKVLELKPEAMRDWIIKHFESADSALQNTEYSGLTSPQIAKKIRDSSPSIEKLYTKYSGKVNIDIEYIASLVTRHNFSYVPDVNIAAAMPVLETKPPRTWIEKNAPELINKTIVTISMEGNIPEFEEYNAQYACTKGGLGAYYGDKLEGLAAIGIKAYGIQPAYSHYIKDGKTLPVYYKELINKGIMEPVLTGKDALRFRIWGDDPGAIADDELDKSNPWATVEVYRVNRGGTWNYLLMSKVFDVLYTDYRAHRFTQEIVFGKASYELMNRLNIIPDVLHLNEAHTVVAAALVKADPDFEKTAIVYTNHTIVPAGLEVFDPYKLCTHVDRMIYGLTLLNPAIYKFCPAFLRPDGIVDFCRAAIELADVINAVSEEHATATAQLFKNMYGKDLDVKVIGILNGSGNTWKSDKLRAVEEKGLVPTKDELWKIHEENKLEAFSEIEKRTGVKLDPAKPTAWAVRRIVDYKSQYPMLRYLVHIMTADRERAFTREELWNLWMCDIPDLMEPYNIQRSLYILNRLFEGGKIEKINGLGMQVVVGGSEYEAFWVHEFNRWSDNTFKGRFVYVPNSDTKILKMQAVGADICITMPRPLEEACGTSDQRTSLNGGINISIKGAGPIEWMKEYDEKVHTGSGTFIGPYTKLESDGKITADWLAFYGEGPLDIYKALQKDSWHFYEKPDAWKDRMLNSYTEANTKVTAKAMEERYALKVYVPAIKKKDAVIRQIDEDIAAAFNLPVEGMVYEIRYDEKRLVECEGAIDIIKKYARLLGTKVDIRLYPGSYKDGLICVKSFKAGNLTGTGLVNISGELRDKQFRIVGFLNMAMAASNIRPNISYEQMLEEEKRLVGLIKNICKEIIGLDVAEKDVLDLIKDLPPSSVIPPDHTGDYHRVMFKRLEESA